MERSGSLNSDGSQGSRHGKREHSSSPNQESSLNKKVKSDFPSVRSLIEGKDYYAYEPSKDSIFSKYIRQMMVRVAYKDRVDADTGETTKVACNFVCLLCDSHKAYKVFGDFFDQKKRIKAGNMVSHLKSMHPNEYHSLDSASSSRGPRNTSSAQDLFNRDVVMFLAEEGISLSTLEKETFRKLFPEGQLPGRRVVENTANEMFRELLGLIKLELAPILSLERTCTKTPLPVIQVCSDGLTCGGSTFTGFGISYVSITWEYRELPLFLHSEENDIADSILARLDQELGITRGHISMGISDTNAAALKVTKDLIDEESNMCSMHLMGLIAGHLCGLKFRQVDKAKIYFALGQKIVGSVINLSRYFLGTKQLQLLTEFYQERGLGERLKPTLAVETRPTSVSEMLMKIFRLKPAIDDFIKEYCFNKSKAYSGVRALYDSVDWNLTAEFEAIMQPLFKWTKAVQSQRRPLLGINGLIKLILDIDFSDTSEIQVIDFASYCGKSSQTPAQLPRKAIKISELSESAKDVVHQVRELVDHYLSLSHQTKDNVLPALFCDPMGQCILEALDNDLHQIARDKVQKIAVELRPDVNIEAAHPKREPGKRILILGKHDTKENNESDSQSSNQSSSQSSQSSSQNEISNESIFSHKVDMEIAKYLTFPFLDHWTNELELSTDGVIKCINNTDPMEWWAQNHLQFPLLSRVARYFLAGSGSTAAQERYFSAVNLTLTDLRSCLAVQKLECLSTLRYNKKIFKELKEKGVVLAPTASAERSWAKYDSD